MRQNGSDEAKALLSGLTHLLSFLRCLHPLTLEDRKAIWAWKHNFTPEQVEIAIAVAQDRTNKDIGISRGVSPDAIEHQLEIIRSRLKVRSRVGVAVKVVQAGLLDGKP